MSMRYIKNHTCIDCCRSGIRRRYEKDPEKINKYNRKWYAAAGSEYQKRRTAFRKYYRNKNIERINLKSKEYRALYKKRISDNHKKTVKALSLVYVRSKIVEKSNIKREDVPVELINLKTMYIKIYRKLKEIRECQKA